METGYRRRQMIAKGKKEKIPLASKEAAARPKKQRRKERGGVSVLTKLVGKKQLNKTQKGGVMKGDLAGAGPMKTDGPATGF